MSHVVQSYSGYSASTYASTHGASGVANELREKAKNIANDYGLTGTAQISYFATVERLREVGEACSERNWGGEDEAPLAPTTIRYAEKFLELLPSRFQSPDVIPEPNGALSLEWWYSQFRSVIVAFHAEPKIEFSVLMSAENGNFGHCRFDGLIPLDVFRQLNAVSRDQAVS